MVLAVPIDLGRLSGLEGGGGDSNMKMPGCVCQESENVPIVNDTFKGENIPIFILDITHTHYRC